MPRPKTTLRRKALRLEQSAETTLYQFSMTGDELLQLADISRISRGNSGKLLGYQRPEIKRHVKDIVDYLNSESVLFPNSLILAFSSQVRFRRSRKLNQDDDLVTLGTLEIPIPTNGGPKPGWVVDGQQRMLAIAKSIRKDMAVPVNAFITDDVHTHRDQFIRVNSAKPLPRGLLTELLPEVNGPLPANLSMRKVPSAICDMLNTEPTSPFYKIIRRPSTPAGEKRQAVVTDSSVVKMIEESISSPSGCLFPSWNIATGETDCDGIWRILCAYWTAVKNVFPEAWGLPPSKSRLMHGAGIRSMGKLMDRVMGSTAVAKNGTIKHIQAELALVKDDCFWTSGTWTALGGLRWNEIQNVPRHINVLSNHLVRTYMQVKGVGL